MSHSPVYACRVFHAFQKSHFYWSSTGLISVASIFWTVLGSSSCPLPLLICTKHLNELLFGGSPFGFMMQVMTPVHPVLLGRWRLSTTVGFQSTWTIDPRGEMVFIYIQESHNGFGRRRPPCVLEGKYSSASPKGLLGDLGSDNLVEYQSSITIHMTHLKTHGVNKN